MNIFRTRSLFWLLMLIVATIPLLVFAQNKKTLLNNVSQTIDKDLKFPEDSRIVNVKNFGAVGDGTADDTEAIQNAIAWALENAPSRYVASPFIYFPKGTYLISDELQSRIPQEIGKWSDGWRAGMLFVGENRAETRIILTDRASGYEDAANPKALIKTGSEHDKNNNPQGGGNRAFRHSIINLTLNTGKGNPGAIGIDYLANNRGTIKDVIIRSGDRQGTAGISMIRNWPGPALVKNVEIEGFDYGVKIGKFDYSMTFENLTLKNQNKTGILNDRNALAIRKLHSINTVPALDISGTNAYLTLIDSKLENGAIENTAINTMAKMFLRNVDISGYGRAIQDELHQKNVKISGNSKLINQYATDIIKSTDSPAQTLNLPIEDAPAFHTNDFSKWANVEDFGATPNNDLDDDAPAIQAAIDSGAEIVYLPNGVFDVKSTIVLRGSLKKLLGMQSAITQKTDFSEDAPILRFDGSSSPYTIVEQLNIQADNKFVIEQAVSIEHNSPKTLVVAHCGLSKRAYRNTDKGTGKMFWEDNMGRRILIHHPQSFWARQLNAEFGKKTLVENHGGNLWILGMKTEGETTVIETIEGKTELLGAHLRTLNPVDPSTPMFVNDRSSVSLSWGEGPFRYEIKVKERQNDTWQELKNSSLLEIASNPASRIPLYTGYSFSN